MLDNEIVEIRDISRIIKDKLFENPLLIVSLKTHKDSEYDAYIRVLDELKDAGATRISIADPDTE